MSKKLHSKLLAVILSLAICCATLCGSIFAAHAAAAYYNGTYSFEGGVAPYGAKQATIDVTFSLDAGFVAGEFALDNTAGNFASIASAEITNGIRQDGSAFDASVIDVSIAKSNADGQLPKVIFYGKSDDSYDVGYTSITFKLTINMTSSVAASSQYSVALADYTFTELGGTDLGIEFTGNAGSIHTHSGSLDMNSLTSESNKNFNSVYHQVDTTAKCTYCGAESYIQLYPDYNTDSSAVAAGTQPDGNIGISGITVVHNDDGNLSVNIHGCVADGYSDSYIVITDTMGKVVDTITVSDASPYADVILGSNAKMWSYEKLSARDINTELVITLLSHTVVSDKNTLAYSRSFNFSLADYCTKVVDENAMWPVGTSGEQKLADKNVAAGLYYYGASIEEEIFDKNSSTEEFKYVNKSVVKWDGTTFAKTVEFADTGITCADTQAEQGTATNPYIIETPKQLRYVAQLMDTASSGKHFKIADGIAVFDFDNVQYNLMDNSRKFQGHFDGNGVEIRNFNAYGYHAALFPNTSGTTTIENLKISGAKVEATSGYAGGLIAQNHNGSTLNINNLIVIDCNILTNAEDVPTDSDEDLQKVDAGAVVALSGSSTVNMNNCFIANNTVVSKYEDATQNSVIGNGWSTPRTISNSIVIGNDYTTRFTVENNIWSQDTAKTGAGAVAEMNFSSNAWFDTADYPQLRSFHDMKIKSISETQHQLVCAHNIGNTPCDVVGPAQNHAFVENQDGSQKTCSACGYSEVIVSKYETIDANYRVWNGNKTVPTTVDSTDTTGNTYIINTPEELAWVALVGKDDTHDSINKTYKIADNSVFNMNGYTNVNINSTAAEVKAATATDDTFTWDGNSSYFRGNFNGNGAIIYNIRNSASTEYGGLFPRFNYERLINNSSKSATFSNITVKASYLSGRSYVGGIVGYCLGYSGNNLTIENCSVENCYLYSNGYSTNIHNNGAAATLVAMAEHWTTTINNCSVINNTVDATHNDGGFIANSSLYNSSITISNSISIGTLPYPVATETALEASYLVNETTYTLADHKIFTAATYTNVYTDQTSSKTGVTTLDNTDLTGANAVENMNGLDKSSWLATNSYPQLAVFHDLVNVYDDETTHHKECRILIDGTQCNIIGVTEEHKLSENAAGTANECTCGYSEEIITKIEYVDITPEVWSGGNSEPVLDNETNTYIINTPEELAWVALYGGDATAGKTYKVADNQVFNMNGFNGIELDSTATDVKNATATGTNWRTTEASGWYSGIVYTMFQGSFDGNGLIVYNINASNSSNTRTGLFPYVKYNGTYISNVTIKASAFGAGSQTGGIIGLANGYLNSVTTNTLAINNCAVQNCRFAYVGSGNNNVGSLVGYNDCYNLTINNCFTADNIFDAGHKSYGGYIGISRDYGSNTINNSISIGSSPYPTIKSGETVNLGNKLTGATWNKVYTNVTLETAISDITTFDTAQMQGSNAVTTMGLGSAWFATTEGYPELSVFHEMMDVYVDDTNHRKECIVRIDGERCTVCGPVEAHTEGSCVCGLGQDDDSSINYNDITPKVWLGDIASGFSDTTHQGSSEADAIIISTPAELAYLLQISGTTDTLGKYYKAADNLVFDMNGLEGININSTLAEVSAAAAKNNWINAGYVGSSGFNGTFDGNGLVIYNLYCNNSSGGAGLFSVYNGGATIKNLTVKNSKFIGTNHASAIFGLHEHTVRDAANPAVVNNCVVENCDITSTSTNSTNDGVGAVVGSTRWAYHTVNNCLVLNNKITATNGISSGIIGHVQSSTDYAKVNNCVIINSDTSRVAKAVLPTYTNCYTTQTSPDSGLTVKTDAEMKGENTLTAMALDSNWLATNSYPQLAVFHDMVTVKLDGLTHQSICRISIGGTPCSVCTDAVAHDFEENAEHTEINCDVCGYGYAIKGINSLNLPASVKTQLTANATYISNFETNAKFINVYGADQSGEDEIGNEFAIYATTLNLTVNPHFVFQFAFHGDYKTNRSNIYATFTVDGEVYSTENVETDGKLGANWANSKSAGRYHTYRFRQLPISKLCERITVTAYLGDTPYSFGSYSAAGFAINAMGLGADYVDHANAAKALVYYSEMLAAREAVNA